MADMIAVRMTPEFLGQVRTVANAQGYLSVQEYVRDAVRRDIYRHHKTWLDALVKGAKGKKTRQLTPEDRMRIFEEIERETLAERSALRVASPSKTSITLAQKLRDWRLQKARELKKPAYTFMQDGTLMEIAERRPKTKSELIAIRGMGPTRVEKYGDEILKIVSASLPDKEPVAAIESSPMETLKSDAPTSFDILETMTQRKKAAQLEREEKGILLITRRQLSTNNPAMGRLEISLPRKVSVKLIKSIYDAWSENHRTQNAKFNEITPTEIYIDISSSKYMYSRAEKLIDKFRKANNGQVYVDGQWEKYSK